MPFVEELMMEGEQEYDSMLLEGATHPARQFVPPSIATEAAKTFFEDGSRDASFTWEPPA